MYVRRKCFSRDIYGDLYSVKMFSGEESAEATTDEGEKGFLKKTGVVAVPAATAAALAGAGYLGYRTYKKRKNRKDEEED